MNCEKCQNLISEFLDDELCGKERIGIEEHLAKCLACVEIFEDFSIIKAGCDEVRQEIATPPNSQALWLRISNLVESEREAEAAKSVKESVAKQSGWARFKQRNWQFSFSQIASSIVGIVVISSLITVLGVQNLSPNPISPAIVNNANTLQPSLFDKLLVKVGWNNSEAQTLEQENRYQQQLMAIEYWNQRVEARKKQWQPDIRAAFDRNLKEVNQVVVDYNEHLKENPEDRLSEEMLDSALQEKMELLREFSEL